MSSAIDRQAIGVADAAVAWLRDPRDQGAYGRLVAAVEQYEHERQPALDMQLVDRVSELLKVRPTSTAGALLHGDVRDVMNRLRGAAAGQQLTAQLVEGADEGSVRQAETADGASGFDESASPADT